MKKIIDFLLDLLFPKFCVGCNVEGEWICNKCQEKIVYIKSPLCPKCNRVSEYGKICPKCKKKSKLNGLITATYYIDGPIKEAIHTYKYDGVFDLKYELSNILLKSINNYKCIFDKNWIVIAVPIHKKRFAIRGYNQSELLAKIISKKLNIPLQNNLLIKSTYNPKTQAKSNKKERLISLINSFSWVGQNEIKNKKILLVDDVYTTGATMEECAKILKTNGAKQVWGLAIAKD